MRDISSSDSNVLFWIDFHDHDHVHHLLCSSACVNFVRPFRHEKIDAQTYAQWGVDYLKEALVQIVAFVVFAFGSLEHRNILVWFRFTTTASLLPSGHE